MFTCALFRGQRWMSVVVNGIAALKRLFDYAYTSLHQIADPPSGLVGQQVGHPDEQRAGIT
jgi:hypothetical protein